MTEAQARKIALALPEAEEKSHRGVADFRVRNKVFMTFHGDGFAAVFRVPEDDLEALTTAHPETFERNNWKGTLRIRLKTADRTELTELVEESWRRTAPPALLKELDGA